MMLVLLATALLTGLGTGAAMWPVIGAWALVAAPLAASLSTLLMASLFGQGSQRNDTLDLERLSDRLVSNLRGAMSTERDPPVPKRARRPA